MFMHELQRTTMRPIHSTSVQGTYFLLGPALGTKLRCFEPMSPL